MLKRLAAALHAAFAAPVVRGSVATCVAIAAAGAELALPAPMKVAVRCALAVLSSYGCAFFGMTTLVQSLPAYHLFAFRLIFCPAAGKSIVEFHSER